ncbi:MAG: NUDIX domain-containing protein [Candidatus Nanoarchaeia archaeon]
MDKNSPFDLLQNELEQEFKKLKHPEISSVAIYGSHARKESILTWSDLDVLIFTNSIKISSDLLNKIAQIKLNVSKRFSSIPLTFRIHSRDEFPDYIIFESSICSYALFSFYKDIITIYGQNFKEEMRRVLKSISISTVQNDLRSKLIGSRHESRSLLSSSNNIQPFTQSFHLNVQINDKRSYQLGKYIDLVLECALCLNILKGDFSRRKKEIGKKFQELYPSFKYSSLPLEASEIREQWNDSPPDCSTFIQHSAEFLELLPSLYEENLRFNQINNAFEGLLTNDLNIPYRKNVCAIILKPNGKYLIVQKEGKEWQFVQGGVNSNESFLNALKREVQEETGITHYQLISESQHINRFDWPEQLQKTKHFKGQEQHFFILKVPEDTLVALQEEELSAYKWVDSQEIISLILREDILESFNIIREEFKNTLT